MPEQPVRKSSRTIKKTIGRTIYDEEAARDSEKSTNKRNKKVGRKTVENQEMNDFDDCCSV